MGDRQEKMEERRQIRAEYRKIVGDIDEARHALGTGDGEAMLRLVERSNRLHRGVEHPREALADAVAVKQLTSIELMATSRIGDTAEPVTADMFVNNLCAKYKRSRENNPRGVRVSFARVGRYAGDLRIFRVCPRLSFMYGPITTGNVAVKKRRVVVAKERGPREVAPVVKLEVLKKRDSDDDDDDLDHTKNDEAVRKGRQLELARRVVSRGGKTAYWPLVLDADSFSKTVENMLDHSFLVRDGHATLGVDQSVGAMTEVTQRQLSQVEDNPNPVPDDAPSQVMGRQQTIVKLTFGKFNKLKGLVNVNEEGE